MSSYAVRSRLDQRRSKDPDVSTTPLHWPILADLYRRPVEDMQSGCPIPIARVGRGDLINVPGMLWLVE